MKIAIAMLCHKNVEQIDSLIHALENDDISFFIHVDKKSNVERDKIIGKNVHVLLKDESIDIQWGGFGMIEATLRLIEEIRKNEKEFDYVWLMSGQDYPLRSVEEIIEYFKQFKDADFLEILPNEEAFGRGYFKRNELYYPKWMVSNKIYIKIIKHLLWAVTGGRQSTNLFKRKTRIEQFYYGSQWWVMSRKSIELIMNYLQDNPWYAKYFKNSLVPDESFFQTLYGMLIGVERARPSICYVNWGKNCNSPEILTYGDIDSMRVIKKDYLLVRKVDFDIDDTIKTFPI